MEMGSDGEEDQIRSVGDVGGNHLNKKKKIDNSSSKDGGRVKPKRQMKTPFQLETLEKVYSGSSDSSQLFDSSSSSSLCS